MPTLIRPTLKKNIFYGHFIHTNITHLKRFGNSVSGGSRESQRVPYYKYAHYNYDRKLFLLVVGFLHHTFVFHVHNVLFITGAEYYTSLHPYQLLPKKKL